MSMAAGSDVKEDLTMEALDRLEQRYKAELETHRSQLELELKETTDALESIRKTIHERRSDPTFGMLERVLEFERKSQKEQADFLAPMAIPQQLIFTRPDKREKVKSDAQRVQQELSQLEGEKRVLEERATELHLRIEGATEFEHRELAEIHQHKERLGQQMLILAELRDVTYENYRQMVPSITDLVRMYIAMGGKPTDELVTAVHGMGESLDRMGGMRHVEAGILEPLFSLMGIQVLVDLQHFKRFIDVMREDYRPTLSEHEFVSCCDKVQLPHTDPQIEKFQQHYAHLGNTVVMDLFHDHVRRARTCLDEKLMWTCASCTASNSVSSKECSVCDTVRPAPNWSCEICTYENGPASSICAMCQTQRPSHASAKGIRQKTRKHNRKSTRTRNRKSTRKLNVRKRKTARKSKK
jgi:hypothetical protein